ncbi:ornithine cyclodeaminase family protein [Ensifer sp. ENS05]|uniref:ornithine cyclodeaminase family protein n=1 Tax=Ensifer sp. ENS05 TaxID=2769277 RepID=UPI00178430BC|nr:ornithine cyclodeaminase family protein [Ensifer sp. ENS05]MBD9596916.1 ornithine cyclodeaminase family protein [Ensifer sp. ENS05]
MSQQPKILGEAEVNSILDKVDVRGALERAFKSLGKGHATQPPQTLSLFPNDAGDFITYLGVLTEERVFGAKLSPYIPGTDHALVTAWTLLMSMDTGTPVLLCDSKRLTTERTAAATIIAADLLARPDASILTIVGTGPVGLAHLRYAATLRNWKEVRLCSPLIREQQDLPRTLASGCPILLHTDSAEAADGADVVMLCTSSGKPVLDVANLAPGVLVTSISTNVPNAHEIDPAYLPGFDVYCDYRATTPAAAGEMKLATAAGHWTPDRLIGDLPELLIGKAAKPTGDRPVFFRSIGLGLEDVAAAVAILNAV